MSTYTCKVCNKEITKKGFGCHIKMHKLTAKEYYDKYLRQPEEGICPICGKETPFLKISKGYQKHCSVSCSQLNPEVLAKTVATRLERYGVENFYQNPKIQQKAEKNAHSEKAKSSRIETSLKHYGVKHPFQSKEIKEKIEKTNVERYGCKAYNHAKGRETMKERYGYEHALQVPKFKQKQEHTTLERFGCTNAYANEEIRAKILNKKQSKSQQYAAENNLILLSDVIAQYGQGWFFANISNIIKYNGICFVKQSDIPKIAEYDAEDHSVLGHSDIEKSLVSYIKEIYSGVVKENNRRIIPPKEIDIYLPDLKLAIEYNGNYWHSSEHDIPEDYHLMKSLKCREKGIRLIHIYEFEDFEQQKQLLKNLILGEDNYPKNDFNKNNLIDNIPEPVIIYDEQYTVYGAGPLY